MNVLYIKVCNTLQNSAGTSCHGDFKHLSCWSLHNYPSLSSVRCHVVRCCGFHDSSPSLPILCCSHSILQCHPCRALDVLEPWCWGTYGLSFSFRWPSLWWSFFLVPSFELHRHLSLSSAALTASCSVIPVELLMSLSHDVGGRPLFLFPLTFPVMIVLSSPFLRITCPKKHNFRLRTITRSISLFPILSKTHALVFLSVHGILRTLL